VPRGYEGSDKDLGVFKWFPEDFDEPW
jgi:hypothetical protein